MLVLTNPAARCRAESPAATPSQAALLDVLKSKASREQKAAACRQLAWIGDRDAVPVLSELLADEQLSHMARYALEQIADPSAADALREAAGKLKGKQLAGVLNSLGMRRDAKSIEMLSQHVKDSDADVAKAAAFALGKIGNSAAGQVIEQALPAAADAVKPALYDAALRCADALVTDGRRDEAVGMYERLAASNAPVQFRVAANRGAILIGPKAQTRLIALFDDKDRAFFNLVLSLARELRSEETTRTLAAHVGKLSPARQALVIEALGERGDKAALPAIRAASRQTEPAIRIAAIRAIALLGDTASLTILLEATASSDKTISEAAAAAVVKLPGDEVDQALVAMIQTPDVGRRLVAMDCLARRRNPVATQALLKMAGEGAPPVRAAAIRALAEVATAADLPSAIGLLQRLDSPADCLAAENLVTAICISADDKDACAEKIIAALGSTQPQQKLSLLRILGAVGGSKGLQAVREAARDTRRDVREAAVAALAAWPEQAAAPDLLALARSATPPSDRLRALRGYLRLALDVDLPHDKRLEMCREAQSLIERDDERRLLVRVLSRIQSAKALVMITPLLENPAVSEDAAAAAIAVAGKLSSEPDARQSAAAIFDAMGKIKQTSQNADLLKKAADLQDRVRPLVPKQ
jgi:HEAT repeat protein